MRKIFCKLLLLALIICLSTQITLFNLASLTKSNGAQCMDGSQYGVYIFNPDDSTPAPNKLMVYFQEIWEGWCAKDNLNDSLARCYKYLNDSNLVDYGSSNNWGQAFTVLTGILSSNSVFGPWPKILIKSCDGGSYFSDSTASFKNKTMNFKGSNNVKEAMNYLNKIGWLANREEIVLVGVGNGGLGALAWAQTFMASTKGKVKVLVDGGIWENEVNQKTKQPVFENRLKTVDKLYLNGKAFPNAKCQAANPDTVSSCFYASKLTKYIDSSIQIMFLDSYYDTWSAEQILGIDCTQQFGSLSECTADHKQAIQDYHKKVQTSMVELVKLPNVGAYGIACVAHFFTNGKWDNSDFSVPMGSNNTAQVVVQKWLASKNASQIFRYLDTVNWPDNKPCSHQVKGFNLSTE